MLSTSKINNSEYLHVPGEILTKLSEQSFSDIAHLLRPAHLQSLQNIQNDPESSDNDKFVALELLKNACIAAGRVLPSCQDTGTAISVGKKGHLVLTDGRDEEYIAKGVQNTQTNTNLRYSQVAPINMFEELNTKTNLPGQFETYSVQGSQQDMIFIAKGGGSANKTFLFQQTKALLNEKSLMSFIEEKVQLLGTSACPPQHLCIVIGGPSAEYNLKMNKLATTRYLDNLPESGNELGRAFRCIETEKKVHKITQDLGIGAQFGGKQFCHDVRVIRMFRHGASCPVSIGVSCSADRQQFAKVNQDGVYIERLEANPAQQMPDIKSDELKSDNEIQINLNEGMDTVRSILTKHPVATRLSLSGTLVVARDIAHAKIKQVLDQTGQLPDQMKQYPVQQAGPAKTPTGYASGSFGPTTAGRMDSQVDEFQKYGGSMIMLAKGNRSAAVTRACKNQGGFQLGSTGGPAANLAKNCIKSVQVLDQEEEGMEAVWKIEIENFPAFIVVDDKGNDFYKTWRM